MNMIDGQKFVTTVFDRFKTTGQIGAPEVSKTMGADDAKALGNLMADSFTKLASDDNVAGDLDPKPGSLHINLPQVPYDMQMNFSGDAQNGETTTVNQARGQYIVQRTIFTPDAINDFSVNFSADHNRAMASQIHIDRVHPELSTSSSHIWQFSDGTSPSPQ